MPQARRATNLDGVDSRRRCDGLRALGELGLCCPVATGGSGAALDELRRLSSCCCSCSKVCISMSLGPSIESLLLVEMKSKHMLCTYDMIIIIPF